MRDRINHESERLLVCVGPGPDAPSLIHAAGKMAAAEQAKWYAVYVESPKMMLLSEAERHRIADSLRLAEQLGAETFTLRARHVAEEIMSFARERKIAKIVAGKPRRALWKSISLRGPVDQLVRISEEIEVCIIAGEPGETKAPAYVMQPERIPLSDYGTGILFLILASVLSFIMYPYFDLSNLIMVYLLGVMLTAVNCGRGPAILISFLSVLAFDVFFVPPRFSLTVEESQYIVTFIVMLLVALVISHLTSQLRQQAAFAHGQERQATAMHGLSRQLASTRGTENILRVAVQYIAEIFDCHAAALLPNEKGSLHVAAGDPGPVFEKDIIKELHIARSAFDAGRMTGWGTQPSPPTEILYVPLQATDVGLALLALRPRDPKRFLLQDQLYLLESLAKQVALALEVEHLTGSAPVR